VREDTVRDDPPERRITQSLGVTFHSVEKRFGVLLALRRVSLEIAAGEFVVLLGHNGSGKTTLLRVAAMLAKPTAGRVSYSGMVAANLTRVRARIGMVAHHSLLYDELTAEENLRFLATLYGLENPAAAAQSSLEPAGLSSRKGDLVRTFSRGMRQRLAFARAVLAGPALLLLDEPASGLDRDGAAWLARTLRALQQEGCTILMSSHGQNESTALATRAVAMHSGAVIADSGPSGDVRSVMEEHASSAGRAPEQVPSP